jgi:hypothetical protein
MQIKLIASTLMGDQIMKYQRNERTLAHPLKNLDGIGLPGGGVFLSKERSDKRSIFSANGRIEVIVQNIDESIGRLMRVLYLSADEEARESWMLSVGR